MLRELREDENAVIDYLKIDVEGDELAVLQGLRDEHVPIVRQAVIEVHSKRLADDVRTYMERHGFEIAVDAGLSSGTGVRRVYAFRP
ncbi:MAG: FkbM family methyltransferase [Spirochaetaceae bacterium]|nr:MAG: FkbM family methyltransferase [Spirochaetaceae bacterium]